MAEYRRAPPKPLRQALLDNAPWKPLDYDIPTVAAFKQMQHGKATPDQQKLALKWLVEIAADYYGISYRPGEDGRRDSDFAEGRRFVGQQIVKLLNLNTNNMKAREEK